MIGHRPVDQSFIPMCCLSSSVRFYTTVSLTCVHYKIMPTSVLADHTILPVSLRRRNRKVKQCCRTAQGNLQEIGASIAHVLNLKKGNFYLVRKEKLLVFIMFLCSAQALYPVFVAMAGIIYLGAYWPQKMGHLFNPVCAQVLPITREAKKLPVQYHLYRVDAIDDPVVHSPSARSG